MEGACTHWRYITQCPWLPIVTLVTSQLVSDNRKFDCSVIFLSVLLVVDGGELITTENASLSVHGYQLLPPATSQLVGNNTEFDILDIFWDVLLIVYGEELITIDDP